MTNHPEPEEIRWQGKFITARTRGKWEYVSRARGIRAAVILAIDDAQHVLLVEQYRVPLGKRCLELPAGLVGEIRAGHHAAGLVGAIGQVGAVLAEHFPRADDDINELPDRLIEV